MGVSIGQVYGQEITYKTLKPTIVGTGIQAAEFGWTLSDEMVDMSAKRLIAIIGVPKKSTTLELQMAVTARIKPHSWWPTVQANIASTDPWSFSVELAKP